MKNAWNEIFFFDLSKYFDGACFTHAQLPTPIKVDKNEVRVFYAVRNNRQVSNIYFSDILIKGSQVRVLTQPELCLNNGPIGFFDEHGVFPASVIYRDGTYYMYYIGWNKGATPPLFYTSIGLAISNNGVEFERYSPSPIMSRSRYDPCLVTSPDVYIDHDGFRMTYVSGIEWTDTGRGLQSHYHIKHAFSSDGVNWKRDGRVAIDFADGETNIARSSVFKNADDDYEMWFSYVHSEIGKYRLGYAKSEDGILWDRQDHLAGFQPGNSHYREMVCYPQVIEIGGDRYLFFNGDNFGKQGFGLAIETTK